MHACGFINTYLQITGNVIPPAQISAMNSRTVISILLGWHLHLYVTKPSPLQVELPIYRTKPELFLLFPLSVKWCYLTIQLHKLETYFILETFISHPLISKPLPITVGFISWTLLIHFSLFSPILGFWLYNQASPLSLIIQKHFPFWFLASPLPHSLYSLKFIQSAKYDNITTCFISIHLIVFLLIFHKESKRKENKI